MKFLLVLTFAITIESLKLRKYPEQCANLTLLEALDPPGPITALASMPGSGNTWMRHLLQLATGHYTGSEYEENEKRLPGGFLRNGSAVVVKNHFFQEHAKR